MIDLYLRLQPSVVEIKHHAKYSPVDPPGGASRYTIR